MFYVGCLTRTIFFLDACMDALAYTLLFFSLIKLFIIIFFYSFLYVYRRQRQKRVKKNFHFNDDSSIGRYSSSFDSSPPVDNLQRKTFISPIITDQDENENRRILHNEYETSIISPSNELPTYYEQNVPRKLSSISEITEKTETDDSESDLSHVQYFKPKRKAIITTIHQKPSPPVYPKRKPIIKNRRKIIQDDDNDSGSELKTKFSKNQFFFLDFRC
jgi:hypothetical protein